MPLLPARAVTAGRAGLTIRLSPAVAVDVRGGARPAVALRFGPARRGVDVSIQPAAVVALVDERARDTGVGPAALRGEVAAHVTAWEPSLSWCPEGPNRLMAVLGAHTFPLLAGAYRHGRAPMGEVPRWAAPVLRHRSVAAGVSHLLGGARNRRLTRTVAASLLSDPDRVTLAPLGFAVAGAGAVGSDHLANAVAAAASDGGVLDVDELRIIRQGLARYPADRRAPLLVDAARHHDAPALAAALLRYGWVARQVASPPPVSVVQLQALTGRLVPVLAPPAPRPPPAPVATPARPAVVAHAPTPRPQVGALPLAPPATPAHSPVPASWPITRSLGLVHGHRCGPLRLVVPTSADELAWWGRRLDNCLASFARAAAAERSWLVGIEDDDRLLGCVEVDPRGRRVRQALGPRNRRLPAATYDAVTDALRALGVLAG